MKIAWLTDTHGIFVDRWAWELALLITHDYRPTHVPVGSDDIDFYTLSYFDRDPARCETLQDELDFQALRFWELKDACEPGWQTKVAHNVEYPTVIGNHNKRLMKALWRDNRFASLRNLGYAELMDYDRFSFSWRGGPHDYNKNLEWWATPDLLFTHGTKACPHPGYSVKNQLASRMYDASLVMGHCHRGARLDMSKPSGGQLFGIEGYCLCQLDPEYAPVNNWTQGIVLVTVHPSGTPEVELVAFHRSSGALSACWRGREYSVSFAKHF